MRAELREREGEREREKATYLHYYVCISPKYAHVSLLF